MRFDPGKAVVTGQPEPVTQRSLVAGSGDVSHDGEWGAFTTQGRQKEDVFVIRKDGTGIRQLTDDPYRNRLPTWSPDGKRLAFYSNRSGKMEIWTIHSDGGGLQQLTYTRDGYVQLPRNLFARKSSSMCASFATRVFPCCSDDLA